MKRAQLNTTFVRVALFLLVFAQAVASKSKTIPWADRALPQFDPNTDACYRYTCQIQYCLVASVHEPVTTDQAEAEGACVLYDEMGPDCGGLATGPGPAPNPILIHCLPPNRPFQVYYTIWRAPSKFLAGKNYTINWRGEPHVRVIATDCKMENDEPLDCEKGVPNGQCMLPYKCSPDPVTISGI